jgi:low affinity Fe/Cu permease
MLHGIDSLASASFAAVVVGVIVVVFVVILAINGFPSEWENAFSAVASSVTLVMLFVIQHTQSRHQASLQLKLDELIRTSPGADDQLVRIEMADEAELDQLTRHQQALHESIREGDSLEVIEYNRRDAD